MDHLHELIAEIEGMSIESKVEAINRAKVALHKISPFSGEPVDCVVWVKSDCVRANDYNPNSVAPPEMELLRHSIYSDGYTQPIVTWKTDDINEVIDGFHRHRVGKECEDVRERVHGYLPVVSVKQDRHGKNDRVASTIRHNRARGKHRVDAMSDIVIDLKRRNWSPKKIAKELGMDQDEVLRLAQITGLAEMFSNRDFSEAWEAESYEEEEQEINEDMAPLRDMGRDPSQHVGEGAGRTEEEIS